MTNFTITRTYSNDTDEVRRRCVEALVFLLSYTPKGDVVADEDITSEGEVPTPSPKGETCE